MIGLTHKERQVASPLGRWSFLPLMLRRRTPRRNAGLLRSQAPRVGMAHCGNMFISISLSSNSVVTVCFFCVRFVGQVKEVDESSGCLTVHFYHGTPQRALSQLLRPWTKKDSRVLVEKEDVFLTFDALTTTCKLPKYVKGKVSDWVEGGGKKEKGFIVVIADRGDEEEEEEGSSLGLGRRSKGKKKKKKQRGGQQAVAGKGGEGSGKRPQRDAVSKAGIGAKRRGGKGREGSGKRPQRRGKQGDGSGKRRQG